MAEPRASVATDTLPAGDEAVGADYRAAATVDVEDDDADRESDRNGSHFLAEDRPEPVADRLLAFLADT